MSARPTNLHRGLALAVWMTVVACGGSEASPTPSRPAKRDGAPSTIDSKSIVEVPAGAFKQGLPAKPQGPYGSDWFVNETPEHQVTLEAFAIDRDEVTVERYTEFLDKAGGMIHWSELQPIDAKDVAGARTFVVRASAEKEPIRGVTWYGAHAFCAWVGGRLPTEAQWERVARGLDVTARRFPWGADWPTCAHAVFFTGSDACATSPLPVGTRPLGATPEGVDDLAGNVAEWVADWYGPYAAKAVSSPVGPESGTERVVRGGGYRDIPSSMRTTARWGADPSTRSEGVGLRCAYAR